MAGLHGSPLEIFEYDVEEYDFRSAVEQALDAPDLSRLHRALGDVALLERKTDQFTDLHKRYYEQIGKTEFYKTYHRFVERVIEPLFDEPIYAQAVPTFRVHLPGNRAVGEYHRDSKYNHSQHAVNLWLPMTETYGTNALHVALREGEQPKPIEVPFGSFIMFDGVGLWHGNEVNTTGMTRVSVDARMMPQRLYEDSGAGSVNTGVPLKLGGYYADPSEW